MKHSIKKPTLAIAKRLFKRRNRNIKISASWEIKPMWSESDGPHCAGQYFARVRFEAEGYKPKVMRFYSDQSGLAIF
jgi:hypothetical protein